MIDISQQLSVREVILSLTGNKWHMHPTVTCPEAQCMLSADCLRRGYFEDPKGYQWAFGIASVETEEILNIYLPCLVFQRTFLMRGLLGIEEL